MFRRRNDGRGGTERRCDGPDRRNRGFGGRGTGRDPTVERIIGMARRPFDPTAHGWSRTEYLQGDILDRDAVDALVADADVVIHHSLRHHGLARESACVNLAGTRNVFEATVAADRPKRLVYTSVAAYGYHSDNPVPITEDVPPRGSRALLLEQKAACEAALAEITGGSSLEVYVLRPCIVAGPKAPALADVMRGTSFPTGQQDKPGLPMLKPPFLMPSIPPASWFHDDIAAAIALAATTSAARRVQHRQRRRGVDIRCRQGVRCPSGPGAEGRDDGSIRGRCQAAICSVGPGWLRRTDVGGDGHR